MEFDNNTPTDTPADDRGAALSTLQNMLPQNEWEDNHGGDAEFEEAPQEPEQETLSASEKAKYARALAALERKEAELARLKSEAETLKTQKRSFTTEEFEEYARQYLNGTLGVEEDPDAALSPEQRKLKELESRLTAYEREKQEAIAARDYQESVAAIKTYLPEGSPLAAMDWVGEKLYSLYEEAVNRGEDPDIDELVTTYEQNFVADVRGLLTLPEMRRVLLSDPEIRKVIADELSAERNMSAQRENRVGAGARRNGPAVITKRTAAEVTKRTIDEDSDESRRQRALRLLSQNH